MDFVEPLPVGAPIIIATTVGGNAEMSDLITTAERLRTVKTAFLEFVELWAIDELMDQPDTVTRLTGDITGTMESGPEIYYRCLYRGHRLDD